MVEDHVPRRCCGARARGHAVPENVCPAAAFDGRQLRHDLAWQADWQVERLRAWHLQLDGAQQAVRLPLDVCGECPPTHWFAIVVEQLSHPASERQGNPECIPPPEPWFGWWGAFGVRLVPPIAF